MRCGGSGFAAGSSGRRGVLGQGALRAAAAARALAGVVMPRRVGSAARRASSASGQHRGREKLRSCGAGKRRCPWIWAGRVS